MPPTVSVPIAIRPSEVEAVEVPAWEAPEKYGGRFKAFFIGQLQAPTPKVHYPSVLLLVT